MAGKTGTAKVARNGHYVKGAYTASFVGMFPADAPQIVILVKLDNPSKSIYGGKTAAPVTKTVLEAAIAARDAALDRRGLASAPRRVAAAPPADDPAPEPVTSTVVTESAGSVPFEISLEQPSRPAPVIAGARAVPDVQGMSLRVAARTLHRAGFRVIVTLGALEQWPAAGTMAAAGSRVTVPAAP
mgnify:FL=1